MATPIVNVEGDTAKDLFRGMNGADVIGRLNSKMLTGRGFDFATENEELRDFFGAFAKKSKLQRKIEQITYRSPAEKYLIVGFDVFEDDEYWPIFIPEKWSMYSPQTAFKYDYLVQVVVVKEVFKSNGRRYFSMETGTDEKVVRRYFYGDKIFVPLSQIPFKIPANLLKDGEMDNPLGLIPFHDFRNTSFEINSDGENLTAQIQQLNDIFDYLSDELKTNRRMIIGNFEEDTKLTTIQHGKNSQKLPAFIISGVQGIDPDHRVDVVSSNIPWVPIQAAIDSILNRIFGLLGYSYQHYAGNSVASEVMVNNSSASNTVRQKRIGFNRDMELFLEKLFKTAGFEKPEFSFELNENTSADDNKLLAQELELLKFNLTTPERVLKSILGLTEAEVKERIDEIEKSDYKPPMQAFGGNGNSFGADKNQATPQSGQNQPESK